MKRTTLPKFIFFFLTFASCSPSDFKVYSKLDSGTLRVLSLQASQSEIAATGGAVTITPVVANVGTSDSVSFTWQTCYDPGLAAGAEPTCEKSNIVESGSGTVSWTGTGASSRAGTTSTITVNVPSDVLSGRSVVQQLIGVPFLFTYTIRIVGGQTVRSYKQITVVAKASGFNQNPSLSDIKVDNAGSLSSLPSSNSSLTITYPDSAAETYTTFDSSGSVVTKQEELITSWFVTDGAVQYPRTLKSDANNYTNPSSLPNGRNVVWILITRDGRGGEGIFVKTF